MRTYAFIYAGVIIVLFCICPDYPQKLPEGASDSKASVESRRKSLRAADGVDRSSVFTSHEEEEEDLVNPDKEMTTLEILKTK